VRIPRTLLICLAALLLVTACGGKGGSLGTKRPNYEGAGNDFSIRCKVIQTGDKPRAEDASVIVSLDYIDSETGEATGWFEQAGNRKIYAGYFDEHSKYVRVGTVSNPDNNPLSIPTEQWAQITGKIHYDGRSHENRAVFHDLRFITP
jgi:hypothetical protein